MYSVYLLESIETKRWYIDYTPSNVLERLAKHNSYQVLSTKPYAPWRLIYYEAYLDRRDATGKERFLKSGLGRNFLKKQLRHFLSIT